MTLVACMASVGIMASADLVALKVLPQPWESASSNFR
jgi:hypothetical protein